MQQNSSLLCQCYCINHPKSLKFGN